MQIIKTIVGRINEVLPEIPVYMSNLARNILTTVFCFSKSKGNITHDTIDLQDQEPIQIKDITVTPYIVDHSAYGAFMFLIQADGKKVLHTRGF